LDLKKPKSSEKKKNLHLLRPQKTNKKRKEAEKTKLNLEREDAGKTRL